MDYRLRSPRPSHAGTIWGLRGTQRRHLLVCLLLAYSLVMTVVYIRAGTAGPACKWLKQNTSSQGGFCFNRKGDYPLCGPSMAIDCILEARDDGGELQGYVFVKRQDGQGTAVVGGFVEVGETLEATVKREVKEETGADVSGLRFLGVYSHPKRDKRRHTVSAVFVGDVQGPFKAGSDAKRVVVVKREELETQNFAFDHKYIVMDYVNQLGSQDLGRPRPGTSLCPYNEG